MKHILFLIAAVVCAMVANADPVPLTIVTAEDFGDYASISNGTITINGTSITPKVNETTNTQLGNSISNDTSAKTATVTIGGTSATAYTTSGIVLAETTTGQMTVTVGTTSKTAYTKSQTDTLLSAKATTTAVETAQSGADASVKKAKVKINGTALTDSDTVELGSAYIKIEDGKPRLYAR